MKTLTKILSVAVLVALCVCLFTMNALAANDPVVKEIYSKEDADCTVPKDGRNEGFKMSNGKVYLGTCPVGEGDPISEEDLAMYTQVSGYNALLIPWYTAHNLTETDNPGDCQTQGERFWTCTECGNIYKDADGKVEGKLNTGYGPHTVTGSAQGPASANCFQAGTIEYYICDDCGKPTNSTGTITYKQSDIIIPPDPALHEWGEWEIIKPQTNVSPGQKKHTCGVCGAVEYEEIWADGIDEAPYDLYYVIAIHDTWLRGEEPLTFESNLVEKLNAESGPNQNFVGVRIGTDSLYENSFDTFDFWSWDKYIKLGEKTMQQLREGKYRIWVYDKRHPDEYTVSCDFWVVDVPTLEPYSTDKHVVNSSKSLRFIASEEIDPNSVMVGSRKLYDSSDYFVSNDRKSITLSPDFLNARQTGTYTISAVTKDGRTIKTNFYILSTAQASSSPRTGDESQIGLWAAFLLLSGAAIVVMVPKLRKHGAK